MGNRGSGFGTRSNDAARERPCTHDVYVDTEPIDRTRRPRDYRDLIAWQRAVQLAAECIRLSGALPAEERFDLGRQIRRAAVSVAANIAEGNGRFTRADYLRHLSIANGSLKETETHLVIARECGFLDRNEVGRALQLSRDAGRLLTALTQSLRRSAHP